MIKDSIISKLREFHNDDDEQINFILSDAKRIIVTASAGCGKTKAMISKIAYELVCNPNMNYKKILSLTFSVNAASKIKQEASEMLPKLLDGKIFNIDKKLEVSNYHGFSTKIISKHGYTLNNNLNNINNFSIIADDNKLLKEYLNFNECKILNSLSEAIKNIDIGIINALESMYTNILLEKLVPNEIMTFNGLLILANRLLKKESVLSFYKRYYPLIIIDEFQDTNYLAYRLITSLIHEENRVIVMGDDVQTIYRFLGAIPNLFKDMKDKYSMTKMEFNTNYRFKDNEKMMKLDYYLRKIFKKYNYINDFNEEAEINIGFYKTKEDETMAIIESMKEKVIEGNKVALLVNIKRSAERIIEALNSEGLKYFNGLFLDTDIEYVRFHRIAMEIFIDESNPGKSISKRVINTVLEKIKLNKSSITDDDVMFDSLMLLLDTLFTVVKESNLSKEDKYKKINFILLNNSLKRLMNEIDNDIILTTIHGSKGLEWDYVYIPEVTESEFPFYILCKKCKNTKSGRQFSNHCEFTFPNSMEASFKEQLSLFYVGVTRARKDVFLFANIDKNFNGYPKKRSCFTSLPGLKANAIP